MIEPHLRLYSAQQVLTPAQEAEARRFFAECFQAQISTKPVDEQEAETFLRQAYQVAQLPPPERIQWVDGPLEFAAVLVPQSVGDCILANIGDSLEDRIRSSVDASIDASLRASVGASLRDSVWDIAGDSFGDIWAGVWASVEANLWARLRDSVMERVGDLWDSVWDVVEDSFRAYSAAPWLAYYRFFDVALAPNDLHALAHFNELVSGYWLGQEVVFVIRRPRVLACDQQGRPHRATGKCIEYDDGWGFYAWHGVRVPERVILTPEALTRADFLSEPNVEVRRVIQERMGARFVPELGGVMLDSGPRGTLYEVRLPEDDPEGVARYVQVQDASAPRQYFLRVPPTVQTAAEAVAWSFQVAVEEYGPTHET